MREVRIYTIKKYVKCLTEGSGQWTVSSGQRTVGSGQKTVDRGQWTEGSEQKTEDSGQSIVADRSL